MDNNKNIVVKYKCDAWENHTVLDGSGNINTSDIHRMNLFAYCSNNPVMGIDPTGQWVLAALIIACVLILSLKSDSYVPYVSNITEENVNINGTNPNGEIIVNINDQSIQILDSYRFSEQADKERIMEIIMGSGIYKQFGYYRSMQSYIKEWNAHNFAYAIFPWGRWGESTRSVDLNKNPNQDVFRYVYWLF